MGLGKKKRREWTGNSGIKLLIITDSEHGKSHTRQRRVRIWQRSVMGRRTENFITDPDPNSSTAPDVQFRRKVKERAPDSRRHCLPSPHFNVSTKCSAIARVLQVDFSKIQRPQKNYLSSVVSNLALLPPHTIPPEV